MTNGHTRPWSQSMSFYQLPKKLLEAAEGFGKHSLQVDFLLEDENALPQVRSLKLRNKDFNI